MSGISRLVTVNAGRPVQNEVGIEAVYEKYGVKRDDVTMDRFVRDDAKALVEADLAAIDQAKAKLAAESQRTGISAQESKDIFGLMNKIGTANRNLNRAQGKMWHSSLSADAYASAAKSFVADATMKMDSADADAMKVLMTLDPNNVPADFKDIISRMDPTLKAKWVSLSRARIAAETAAREAGKAVLEAHTEISQMKIELASAKSRFANSFAVLAAVGELETATNNLKSDGETYNAWQAEYRQDLSNLLALETMQANAAIRARDMSKKELDQLNQ